MKWGQPQTHSLFLLSTSRCSWARSLLHSFQAKSFAELVGNREATRRTIHMHVAHFLPSLMSTWTWPSPATRQLFAIQVPGTAPFAQLAADCRLINSICQHSSQSISHLQYCTKGKKIMLNILFMEEKIAAENCHIVWSIFIFIPEPWK